MSTPRGAASLIKAALPGWRHVLTPGTGLVTRARTDKDLRKQVITTEPCVSIALRMRHDDGRAAVAVWVDGAFDTGWRWIVCDCDLPGEHPAELPTMAGSDELAAYVASAAPNEFHSRLSALVARKAETARKAAATRAAKRAAATDISSTSAPTEVAA